MYNAARRPKAAREAYDVARLLDPRDARLLYEHDQLCKRTRVAPAARLRQLQKHPELVHERDDLTVEWCALTIQTGRPEKALRVLLERRFQPWEGGEGLVLGQYARARIALGIASLAESKAAEAVERFRLALAPPANLGEAWHLLANRSHVRYWLGVALERAGDPEGAREQWRAAAEAVGDFQEMKVRPYSEMTYYSALAARRLGRAEQARELLQAVLSYSRSLAKTPARIDYFATSLPTMLLFEEDLQERQLTSAWFLEAQARAGLGQDAAARRRLREILRKDPNHALAADLLAELAAAR